MATDVLPEVPEVFTELERENAAMLDRGVYLSGRRFRRQLRATFERNVAAAHAARETGLAKAATGFDPVHDNLGEQTEGLILNAFHNGSMYRLLADVLGEDGVTWSPDVEAANARFFATLTDPVDQSHLFEIGAAVVMDFFLNAAGSWRTFLTYLSRAATHETASPDASDGSDADSITDERKPPSPTTVDLPIGATLTSDSGTPLSAPWRGTGVLTP